MSDTGVEKTEAPAEKPPEVKPENKIRRMEKALASLQKERDEAKSALAKAAEDAQRASMTELDKLKADAAAKAKEAEDFKAEAARARAEREQERLISRMVAKHKLGDPEYGELVLKRYKPEEHEDFDAFVEEVKKEDKFRPLFGSQKIVDEDGEDIIPNARGVSTKTKQASAESADREFAESMFPNNKAKQDSYLAEMKKLRSGK